MTRGYASCTYCFEIFAGKGHECLLGISGIFIVLRGRKCAIVLSKLILLLLEPFLLSQRESLVTVKIIKSKILMNFDVFGLIKFWSQMDDFKLLF